MTDCSYNSDLEVMETILSCMGSKLMAGLNYLLLSSQGATGISFFRLHSQH